MAALYPNIVMFQLILKIALAPLFIVWLGVGSKSCILVAIFIVFLPVVVSIATGLVSANPEVLQHRSPQASGRSFASRACPMRCRSSSSG